MRTYTVIVHEGEPDEGGFWAEVEELPGCFASGETLDELESDVRDAIETYLAALEEQGQPIPEGREALAEGTRRWELPVAV
jgi:predicted RNase H-like HicB family nuclease